jgi:hypothetical protein
VIYFVACFGTALIMCTCLKIIYEIDQNFSINMAYSYDIFQLILNFVSISIIMATAIIVVKKRCNKTLRQHDDARASRRSTVDKYDKYLFCAEKNAFYIFRLAITRIVLLFLNLVFSFCGIWTRLLANSIFVTHDFDHIFMWLCERGSLWNIVLFAYFAELFSYTNGIWILLFVVTGPQFLRGFKNA